MPFYNDEWWKYVLMPVISGCIGWGTNVISLYMTFYPIEYRGINIYRWKQHPFGLIGWQGIVPSKAEKMANVTTDLMKSKLLNVQEIFRRIDIKNLRKSLDPYLTLYIDRLVHGIAQRYLSVLWAVMTIDERDSIVARVLIDFDNKFFPLFITVLQENIEFVLDINDVVVRVCVQRKELLNRIFEECGAKELDFLRRSGLYFGFIFGLIQMSVWMFYRASWVLVVFGFAVGVITNIIALKLIFWPIEPFDFYGFHLHGLYLRRKEEVASSFSEIICSEILTINSIWDSIFYGKLNRNFFALLRSHLLNTLDEMVGNDSRLCISIVLGERKLNIAKEEMVQKVMKDFPKLIEHGYQYMTDVFKMQSTMRERLISLTYAEFERLLHPAFEEDEILLVLVGGVLGGVVGLMQFFILFT